MRTCLVVAGSAHPTRRWHPTRSGNAVGEQLRRRGRVEARRDWVGPASVHTGCGRTASKADSRRADRSNTRQAGRSEGRGCCSADHGASRAAQAVPGGADSCTRAKTAGGVASVVPVGGAEAEAAARAERAERFRLKEEAAAAADRAEAAREDEARRQAAELAAAEADRVALAEVEAAMGSRKLSLAEQVKVKFRVRVRVRARARGRARVRVRARFRVRVGGWRLAIWGLA